MDLSQVGVGRETDELESNVTRSSLSLVPSYGKFTPGLYFHPSSQNNMGGNCCDPNDWATSGESINRAHGLS